MMRGGSRSRRSLGAPLALVASLSATAAAYGTWHIIDTASVVCPVDSDTSGGGGRESNLAASKTTSCMTGLNNCAAVTDGNKECNAAFSSPLGQSLSCVDNAVWVEVDLGAPTEIDEVVLYQYTCTTVSYCGHKVELSSDQVSYVSVFEGETSFGSPIEAEGTAMRFAATTARYVRVWSNRNSANNRIHILEVEVYRGNPPPAPPPFPDYTMQIDYKPGEIDPLEPYIFTFLRTSKEALTIDFSVTDADGKTVIDKQVTLDAVTTAPPTIPGSCRCTGENVPAPWVESIKTTKNVDMPANYGSSCQAWDNDACGDVWADMTLGSWCCQRWCYADPSCPDAFRSEALEGSFFSYDVCDNDASQYCRWVDVQRQRDPCACKDRSGSFTANHLSEIQSDYGSTCAAHDDFICEQTYPEEMVDERCCASWCFVDEACPSARPAMQIINGESMEGLFWSDVECEQDSMAISQCPYKKWADWQNATNAEACQCLDVEMPSMFLPAQAAPGYGTSCKVHDFDLCGTFYPNTTLDMWCCLPWCWVGKGCPDAKKSVMWEGHFWSDLSCAINRTAVKECPYSDSCDCTGINTGVNVSKFGSNYGKSCQAYDNQNCEQWWNGSVFWEAIDARNDWCCDSWCYVNETCPLSGDSVQDQGLFWSYEACIPDGTVYQSGEDDCVAPVGCGCLAEAMPSDLLPTGAPANYGTSCAAHDADICHHQNNMSCCLSWCWVDELCPDAKKSTVWPGHWYATSNCTMDVQTVRDCVHSDICKCAGTNPGVDTALFAADYGTNCSAWDSLGCFQNYGPTSFLPIFVVGGNNDWCCETWCYVVPQCPLADGVGQSNMAWAYGACVDTLQVHNNATDMCIDPNRRLDSGTSSLRGQAAAAPEDIDADNCEEFFLLDGRSPVELPDTWADAREAARQMCHEEGFDLEPCAEAVKMVFDGQPKDDSAMHGSALLCSKLLVAAAAATAAEDTELAGLRGVDKAQDDIIQTAQEVQKLLMLRAGQRETGQSSADLEEVLQTKVSAVTSEGGRPMAVVPLRRLKSGGGSGGSGGTGAAASSRRRVVTRPTASTDRRRFQSRPGNSGNGYNGYNSYYSSYYNDYYYGGHYYYYGSYYYYGGGGQCSGCSCPAKKNGKCQGYSSKCSSSCAGQCCQCCQGGGADNIMHYNPTGSGGFHRRRRTTDVHGRSFATATGKPYGYTDQNSLLTNYGGVSPRSTSYGYSGANAYRSGSTAKVALAAAGGAALGITAGVGAYWVYSSMYGGLGDTSWRRRRAQSAELCLVPGTTDIEECWLCHRHHGACDSTTACYSENGCGMTLWEDLHRDDLMNTGFVPGDFKPPLTVTINALSGGGITRENVCPPETSTALDFAERWGGLQMPGMSLAMTLTRVDQLGTAEPKCRTNTNYRCKSGGQAGENGTKSCYGEEEGCRSFQNALVCFCQEGLCLEGDNDATMVCHKTASVAVAVAPRLVAAFVPMLALLMSLLR